MQSPKAPNKKRPPPKKKIIYIIYLSIYFNYKKKIKYFYWSIKCIKKAPLYPKMQKIKKEKNKIVKFLLTKLYFRRQIH